MRYTGAGDFLETGSSKVVCRGWVWGEGGESLFNRDQVPGREDENILGWVVGMVVQQSECA